MTLYENALVAMERLLRIVGVTGWADSLLRDLCDWRDRRDTSHHRSGYGGMGSFNDIYICQTNRQAVTKEQEPWANELFDWLKSALHYLSKDPERKVTAAELRRKLGRYDSVIAAFVGAYGPESIRGLFETTRELIGWRCLRCGFSSVSPADIDAYIAAHVIPEMVFTACEKGGLDRIVDSVLAVNIVRLDNSRDIVRAAAISAGINIISRDEWMRPCPACESNDTGVYRWVLRGSAPKCFEPSHDNVPLRG